MKRHSPFRSGRWFTESLQDENDPEIPEDNEEQSSGEQEAVKVDQFKQMARAFQRENDESSSDFEDVFESYNDLRVPDLSSSNDTVDFVEHPRDSDDEKIESPPIEAPSSEQKAEVEAGSTKPQTESSGRRAREREQRRRDILDTARRLFAVHGFQGCTMEELCKITEFAKPTLYKFFPSKEELFYTILLEGYSDLELILRGSRKKPRVIDQFRNVCVMYLIYFRKHLDFFQIHRQVGDRLRRDSVVPLHHQAKEALHRIYKGIEDMLRDGLLLGELRPLDPKKTCLIFFEALSVYTYAFRDQEEIRTAHEMADEVLTLFLDGLRLPQAQI